MVVFIFVLFCILFLIGFSIFEFKDSKEFYNQRQEQINELHVLNENLSKLNSCLEYENED